MKVKIGDIPQNKSFDDYPEGAGFVLDDRPYKYDEKTGRFVMPGEPGYDDLPHLRR